MRIASPGARVGQTMRKITCKERNAAMVCCGFFQVRADER